jgi:hypothetical protein
VIPSPAAPDDLPFQEENNNFYYMGEVEPDVVIEGDYNSVGFDDAGLVVWEFSDDDTCEH